MEVAGFSETLAPIYHSTSHHIAKIEILTFSALRTSEFIEIGLKMSEKLVVLIVFLKCLEEHNA
jgi:hypothetical protein